MQPVFISSFLLITCPYVASLISVIPCSKRGFAVAQFFEALRYKPEGRGFDSRWDHWNFSVT
jgi:hypothetical protein